jgi:hypothetical protein
VFDGTDDIIEADLGSQIFKNSSLHTTSLWVKMNEHSSDFKQFFSLGNGLGHPNGNLNHIQLYHSTNHGLRLSFTQHDYRVGEVVPIGQWVHVAYTYDGTTWQNTTTPTNVNIYINGTKVGITSVYQIGGGGGSALDLSIAKLGLGASTDLSDGVSQLFTQCDISNFKLYDTVLTAEEVKTLYDMGRCDEGHHVVNFSKTRVGIGLGDGEAPRGALDVRGDIYGGCPVFFHATRTTHAESTSQQGHDPLVWQSILNNKGGGYSNSTGKFTAPIAGYYEFFYGGMSLTDSKTFELIPKLNNVDYPGPVVYSSPVSGTAHRNAVMSAIVYMNVGDTWHVRIPAGNQAMYGTNNHYNAFTGKFLSY